MSLLALVGATATQVSAPSSGNGHAVLQAALDAKASTGGTVQAGGTFLLGATVTVPDGVNLIGHGPKATVLQRADGFTGPLLKTADLAPTGGTIGALKVDGMGDVTPGTADNVVINSAHNGGGAGGSLGGAYWHIVEVVSVYAQRDNFTAEAVEAKFHACLGFGARRYNYRSNGTDQFFDLCTSGSADNHGFVIEGYGIRLTSCKSWCAGWTSNRAASGTVGYFNYTNPGATNYLLAGANVQVTGCESQDSAGHGAIISTDGGLIDLYVDAAGSAWDADFDNDTNAIKVIGAQYARIRAALGNGTQHVTPNTRYPLWVTAETTGCDIDVWTHPTHLENPGMDPRSSIADGNQVAIQGVPVT